METTNKEIRFIDSNYNDQFYLPDGGVIEVIYPDETVYARCTYIDPYHMYVCGEPYHICQFAEILERAHGKCRPEPAIEEAAMAFHVKGKGYLLVQSCERGWDYTLLDLSYQEIDGGQLERPEISLQEARNDILSEYGWDKRVMTKMSFDTVCRWIEDV